MRKFKKNIVRSKNTHIRKIRVKKFIYKPKRKRISTIIILLCLFLTQALSISKTQNQDTEKLNDYIFLTLVSFTAIVYLFKYEIDNNLVCKQIKAWTSVGIFFILGFYVTNKIYIITNVFGFLLLFYLFYRNSKAFYKSIQWSKVKPNLSIALVNIFQIIIAFGIIYKLIYMYIPTSFIIESDKLSNLEVYFNFIYFSFTTFTTLGFGDILPNHIISKIFVIAEVSLFISLVSISILFITNRKSSLLKLRKKNKSK